LTLTEIQKLVNHLTNEDLVINARIFTSRLTEVDIMWRKVNHILHGWIIGTLSKETFSFYIGLDTTHSIWAVLKNMYAEDSKEHEFTLKRTCNMFLQER